MQLQVLQNTVFKQSAQDSSELPPEDKVSVLAGTLFNLHSWKRTDPNHLKVSIVGEFLGNPPRNTWYAYVPHVQLRRPANLKVIQNTIFKGSPKDSSQLPPEDKVSVSASKTFDLHSWATASNNHYKLALLESLGNPPRNTWYAYTPHIQFINQQPQIVPMPEPPPTGGLPATKQLNVPHKSQLDNALNPTGACNVTSFAMVMAYFQIKGTTNVKQLEDELYLYMEMKGLSRHDPYDLATMARDYGLEDNLTLRGKLSDIRKAIAEGRPCIIHGYFTSFGHIIVVRGYDSYGFRVNDPYGEWTPNGYRTDHSGENLYYSDQFIQEKCSPEGEDYIWLHRLSLQSQTQRSRRPLPDPFKELFNSPL